MSIVSLLKSKKFSVSFDELPDIMEISPGYARKVVADLVEKKIFSTEKDKEDRRKTIYSLNWKALREYLLRIPKDHDEIILSFVDPKYNSLYVAIDEFEVIHSDEDPQNLIQKVGIIKRDSTIYITNVGQPKKPIILGFG